MLAVTWPQLGGNGLFLVARLREELMGLGLTTTPGSAGMASASGMAPRPGTPPTAGGSTPQKPAAAVTAAAGAAGATAHPQAQERVVHPVAYGVLGAALSAVVGAAVAGEDWRTVVLALDCAARVARPSGGL